ncbi:bifunctional UDP-N-acetylglucosamine diphosphorylase/glucosamine-1-phosphate N-acetyltransferase GlmU [Immundisolibacter sp.]|uniref:bifunctional UDP-N-acetylglucosamine diphosphorylase/glucosamine-1-phosphate N-acetyltransferase GlmU n=2 Tax=Immundisolibacter sp. TaxID=1934948 RepID=UPI003563D73F
MSAAPLQIVILAAGQGTRMRSSLPKVLYAVGGRPLLGHVLATAHALLRDTAAAEPPVVVYGHGGEAIRAAFADVECRWAHQAIQRGTGDAVAAAADQLTAHGRVLVLCGDVPLLRPQTLARLLDTPPDSLAILTASLDDPTGYGRIVRDAGGAVRGIVEQRDASAQEQALREVNTGTLLIPAARLHDWLGRLRADNAQGELYLTDVVAQAVADGVPVHGVPAPSAAEVMGINDCAQLAQCEAEHRRRQALRLMEAGVTVRDPARLDVRGEVSVGRDVCIDVGVILEGTVHLGDGVQVGAHCIVRDSVIGAGARVEPFSLIDGARVGDGACVGPYARLRPGTELAEQVHVGNFVEVKNARLGPGAKANHLSYLGDAQVGARVNVGAGTITCNYDGANKHVTRIGDDAFIGSNSALVAPVTIGEGATIGAGSVVVRQAPADALTVTRAPQKSVPGWRRPRKKPVP